jgi:hypothetical protein
MKYCILMTIIFINLICQAGGGGADTWERLKTHCHDSTGQNAFILTELIVNGFRENTSYEIIYNNKAYYGEGCSETKFSRSPDISITQTSCTLLQGHPDVSRKNKYDIKVNISPFFNKGTVSISSSNRSIDFRFEITQCESSSGR